jgi:hypothetical protein
MDHRVKSVQLPAAALIATLVWVAGCNGAGAGFTGGSMDGGGRGPTLDGGHDGSKLTGGDTGLAHCTPPSCADLHATCGAVTDVKCGGVIQCGTCTGDETCGGGGTPNACGGPGGCTKKTCAAQHINCGQAGDGCGGVLACGTCALPQICGGDPARPGQCGCTGTCTSVPNCGDAGAATTLSGRVYDPAGVNGLYNVLVYVPNDTTDPALAPFPQGVTCDVCGATAAGDPLVTTHTAPDGSFTLRGVPVGTAIPLVIQLGHWRRQFTVAIPTPCGANSVAGTTLKMPANHNEGDIPYIAIVTGRLDPVECVLYQIGIDRSEFQDPGGPGHINLYTGTGNGPGEVLDALTPGQPALMAATGGPNGTPQLNNYDMAILECEGYPPTESAGDQAAIAAYTAAGGRVFASDFAYSWLWQNPALMGAANWNGDHSGSVASVTGMVNLPTSTPANPVGGDFQQWLEAAEVPGAATNAMPIYPAFQNTTSVIPPTEEWLYSASSPIQFTFNTPIGAGAANQCGRVTFSDWHSQNLDGYGQTFPGVCPSGALTPQESILEFMLFDLSACVTPYTPICTPTTCAAQGIDCGPAGDGCGNLLECGSCAAGETCGGGGPGTCGNTVKCVPASCGKQGIQCGPAGDGCGGEIQCGNCPTGEICGLSAPGQCGIAGPTQ